MSILDDAHGPVRVGEHLIGHAAYIGLSHLVDAVDGAEQFAPISIAK